MTNATLTEEAPFPGMPAPPELWAVHVQGPDDMVPFLDKAAAEKLTEFLNGEDAKERAKDKPYSVFYNAKLIPWPYSRNAFAEALREETGL
ncbi:hypothetical protein ACH4T9_12510 [Micromonospora sp. NPDC020750]|uniref:hypothetical protein n=1 Tax=unclassified Micromonospora TaxID=2617518 RepID=UPI0037ADED82